MLYSTGLSVITVKTDNSLAKGYPIFSENQSWLHSERPGLRGREKSWGSWVSQLLGQHNHTGVNREFLYTGKARTIVFALSHLTPVSTWLSLPLSASTESPSHCLSDKLATLEERRDSLLDLLPPDTDTQFVVNTLKNQVKRQTSLITKTNSYALETELLFGQLTYVLNALAWSVPHSASMLWQAGSRWRAQTLPNMRRSIYAFTNSCSCMYNKIHGWNHVWRKAVFCFGGVLLRQAMHDGGECGGGARVLPRGDSDCCWFERTLQSRVE